MSSEKLDPATKTILIVDDDESILNLLEILVQRDGFKVARADSAEAAFYKLRLNPDAVLLDLVLPGDKSGLDVLEEIKKLPNTPFVIVITAHNERHPLVQKAGQDPTVKNFLKKPIKQDHLLKLLHNSLNTQNPHPPSESEE